jgi:hypothetical protein
MIRLQCPHCEKTLGVKDALAGRVGVCPQCKNKFRIPQPDAPAEDEPADERVSPAPRAEARAAPKRAPRRDEDDDESDEPANERYTAAPRRESRVQAGRTRRSTDEDDEEAEEPVRPRRRRYEDEDVSEEEDQPVRRQVVKRKKKKRRKSSGGFSALDPYVITLTVLGGVGLLAGLLSLVWAPFSIGPLVLGWLAAMVGGIWFLVVAFQDSALQGLLCFFVPFYSLYYLITHFDDTKRPFFLQLTGVAILMVGSCAGGFSASRQIDTSPQPPVRLRGEHPFQGLQFTRPA